MYRQILCSLCLPLAFIAHAGNFAPIQVNDRTIPEDEVGVLLGSTSAETAGKDALVREQLISRELFAQGARKNKLDKSKAFVTKLRMTHEDLLAREYQAQYVADHPPSEMELQSAYDSLKQRAGDTAYHLRQIFVRTEDEAKNIITRLSAGESFEALAKTESKDEASRGSGGDLGWLTRLQVMPMIMDSVASLKRGEHTALPIKGSNGWHFLLLEDTRPFALANFERVKPELRRELSRQKLVAHLAELRKKAKVN